MVFQSFALWPHMTVAENVGFGLRERRVPRAEIATRVEEALASTRMARLRRRPRSTSCRAASSSASRWRARW